MQFFYIESISIFPRSARKLKNYNAILKPTIVNSIEDTTVTSAIKSFLNLVDSIKNMS